jgi:hypothetical protein
MLQRFSVRLGGDLLLVSGLENSYQSSITLPF